MYETQTTSGKLLNSIENTCDRLDLGKTTIYDLMKSGRLEAVKMGTKTLITEASIHALLSQLKAAAQMEAA